MRNCVLIIESDKSVGHFLQMKLESEGFTCLLDNTGESAVDLAGQRQVDLIILDPDAPMKGGHEILEKVRAVSTLPVIYLSENGSVDAKVRALDAGADDYLSKPYATKELVARVRAAQRCAVMMSRPLLSILRIRFVICTSIRTVMKSGWVMNISI